MKHYLKKETCFTILLVLAMFLVACSAPGNGSSNSGHTETLSQKDNSENVESSFADSSLTESELLELHAQRVLAMLDECRPEEAYQFPDFSGEITDVRITVREREVDMYLWTGEPDVKVYDIFYGYLSNGVWHDFPSGNYELRDISSEEIKEWFGNEITTEDSWEICTGSHVVEVGPYVICAFPISAATTSVSLPMVTVNDTLSSSVLSFTEYYDLRANNSDEAPVTWHFKENMRAYGTEDYDFYMDPFSQWYFIVLEKEQLTEEYSIVVTADWEEDYNDEQNTYTYAEIMAALNR